MEEPVPTLLLSPLPLKGGHRFLTCWQLTTLLDRILEHSWQLNGTLTPRRMPEHFGGQVSEMPANAGLP